MMSSVRWIPLRVGWRPSPRYNQSHTRGAVLLSNNSAREGQAIDLPLEIDDLGAAVGIRLKPHAGRPASVGNKLRSRPNKMR